MLLIACECEHAAHCDKLHRTPNGNPGHKYGTKYAETFMVSVRTPYGTFVVCRDCANDCQAKTEPAESPCNCSACLNGDGH